MRVETDRTDVRVRVQRVQAYTEKGKQQQKCNPEDHKP